MIIRDRLLIASNWHKSQEQDRRRIGRQEALYEMFAVALGHLPNWEHDIMLNSHSVQHIKCHEICQVVAFTKRIMVPPGAIIRQII